MNMKMRLYIRVNAQVRYYIHLQLTIRRSGIQILNKYRTQINSQRKLIV